MAASTSTAANPNNDYDVFINHRGYDAKANFGSALYRRLCSHRLTAFLDRTDINSEIEGAIGTASVHVAIFSPGYAKSKRCLDELVLMLQSGAPILPVYYFVRSSDLRVIESSNGVYTRALQMLAKKTTLDPETQEEKPLYDPATIENWTKALSFMADKSGFELGAFQGEDEAKLLDHVVEWVLKNAKKIDVFINHRGPDVKKTFASYLYHRLRSHRMRVFLDQEELQAGDNLSATIEATIRRSFVHVVIFSPRYAESIWCLKELVLMLESRAPVIPVFYHVKPSQLRWTVGKSKLWWTKVKGGTYAQALHKLERKKRCDSPTMQIYRNALSHMADTSGFDLETYNGDEGQMLEEVLERLLNMRKKYHGMEEGLRV